MRPLKQPDWNIDMLLAEEIIFLRVVVRCLQQPETLSGGRLRDCLEAVYWLGTAVWRPLAYTSPEWVEEMLTDVLHYMAAQLPNRRHATIKEIKSILYGWPYDASFRVLDLAQEWLDDPCWLHLVQLLRLRHEMQVADLLASLDRTDLTHRQLLCRVSDALGRQPPGRPRRFVAPGER